jgi:hypothetical protein
MDDGTRETARNPIGRSVRWSGLKANHWVVLAVLGGLLLAIVASLVLVLRSGLAALTPPALPTSDPQSDSTPAALVVGGKAAGQGVYWPPNPQPLAPPDAPGNRIWWDARFAYRHAVLLDEIARRAPGGRAVKVLWDGHAAVREGAARADGADVRVVYWDGQWWHELAREMEPGPEGQGWTVSFALAGGEEQTGRYHLYYGHPGAAHTDLPLPAEGTSLANALALALGPQEAVEWGPTVTWTAHSTATQTLVSPDGRFVFEHPAGGLQRDTRVQLRIVPLSERRGFGPLPEYEFHADPPPGRSKDGQNVLWDPPLSVTINWAGLTVDASSVAWAHFRHDSATGTWNPVPVDVNVETGILRFTTDQP